MSDDPVSATRALLEILLAIARDANPAPVGVTITTDPAEALDPTAGEDLSLDSVPGSGRIFDGCAFPDPAQSFEGVFGVDLGNPPGATAGRFVSHPDAAAGLRAADDTGPRTVFSTPPSWTIEALRVYDQSGARRRLYVVAATAPEPSHDPGFLPD